eukprot:TRINITY_DN2831_c0_g1_i1.p1 TRINITY_DN2831_c0_g1~~TRINITY_DN2831_c0_g1_i1.p1  ORF type:complete len:4437 (+),score=698.95 TRINITY_DN2831_c0_g1_i1:410-13720(+)
MPEIRVSHSKLCPVKIRYQIEWTDYIKEHIKAADEKKPEETAVGEIEYWRSRLAILSPIHEQFSVPEVRRIYQVIKEAERNDQMNITPCADEFNKQREALAKQYAEAKDNVKYLSTLDRQFKNLREGNLVTVEETLTSLMNGLKLVWKISRHITQEQMYRILTSISKEIQEKVKREIKIKEIFNLPREEAKEKLSKATKCLEGWQNIYDKTKKEINKENGEKRWEFYKSDLFSTIEHMTHICKDLYKVCTEMHQFESALSSNLKAVVGDPKRIDDMKEELRSLTAPLEGFAFDVFDSRYEADWNTRFRKFSDALTGLDKQVVDLIETSFKQELKSAEGAFDLLQNFKNVTDRESIIAAMQNNYNFLLGNFDTERKNIEAYYEARKADPPIAKGKPPKAGKIAWMRSLYGRLKRPMFKFKRDRKDLLTTGEGKRVLERHRAFYDNILSKDETSIFEEWNSNSAKEAMNLLKDRIIKKEEGSNPEEKPPKYHVNFHPDLRMIIREAKNFERMGLPLNSTVKNIALQEEDYLKVVDKLKFFLKDYKEIVGSLKPVDYLLLKEKVKDLTNRIDYGSGQLNWNALVIDQFLKDCENTLKLLKKTKQEVGAHQAHIKEKVKRIKNAVIIKEIDWSSRTLEELITFYTNMEDYRRKKIAELVEDYKSIGTEDLPKIKEQLFGNSREAEASMIEYYRYWEKKILNSLIKMTVRGLATIISMFNFKWSKLQSANSKCKDTLFVVEVDFNHPETLLKPSEEDVEKRITAICNMPLQCAKRFKRWEKGGCSLYEHKKKGKDMGDEEESTTFYKDLEVHIMISAMQKTLVDNINNQFMQGIRRDKTATTASMKIVKTLWDMNRARRLDKKLEKNPSCMFIDKKLSKLNKLKEDLEDDMKNKQHKACGPYKIDKTECLKKMIDKIEDRMITIIDKVHEYEKSELKKVNATIDEFKAKLSLRATDLNMFKILLKEIRGIKEAALDMELKITDLQEKFDIIAYFAAKLDSRRKDGAESVKKNVENLKNNVDNLKKDAENLKQDWESLMDDAQQKEDSMVERKKQFALETQKEVEEFDKQIKTYYQAFVESGPKAISNTLDQGLEAMHNGRAKLQEFNEKKMQLVLEEKLFGLPISTFQELKLMEEDIKEYETLYALYEDYKKSLAEYTNTSWKKFEVGQLRKSCEEWIVRCRHLQKKNEDDILCNKLYLELNGFNNMITFLESLKKPSVKQSHWDKILENVGVEKEFNMETGKVSQVLELKLQDYKELLEEILTQADQEYRNEETLREMEKTWRELKFEMSIKKEYEDTPLIRSIEDIREKLDECVTKLQYISGNKYVHAVREKVALWQKQMNTINDVTEMWLKVQQKWINLKIIFSTSTDIRQKLSDITAKFDATNKRFKKIMDSAYKTPNVLQACKADGRLEELTSISHELDKCQKALSTYLDSKRLEYPRFYFIAEEEVLSIIGSTNPLEIKKHVSKLFANCKDLSFDRAMFITGMVSEEGEEYEFKKKPMPNDAVEKWMNKVDEAMIATLHWKIKEAVFNYAKMDRIQWIKDHLGMITVVGTQIWWTFAVEDVFRRVKEGGDKHAMKKECAKQTKDLNDLIDLVRKTTDNKLFLKINTLLILDAHARDIVDRFVRDSILDIREFEWESQLRFYWDKAKDGIEIRQCSGSFAYGYEYQGLKDRLVITPLTDRCIMTLTTALRFQLGGAPAGPAGTGKTETIKDLAKSMGYCCVVTNCNPTMDHKTMGTLFSGLAQTGFWGCFDEINRLSTEVLSVIASQISTIQQALQSGKTRVSMLDQNNIRLRESIGIFVTMNPDYEGRSQLPENLKMLFRPVTMVVPDSILICEILLMSNGFLQAKTLAKKMTVLYDLVSQQLSKQRHYDFGLRALKSVLRMAGKLKKANEKDSEEVILMRALRDMNMPKFIFEDVPLFEGLVKDLFPKLVYKADAYGKLKERVELEMDNKGLRFVGLEDSIYNEQANKVIQLYETMETRHSTMVVGPTGGGKSTIINLLASTLESWKSRKIKREVLNPKSINLDELYGRLEPSTRDWEDGLLSKIFRRCNEDPRVGDEYRWIIFDGDVDTIWVENMNTVMDDSKLLTLPNGDRIKMESFCLLLYEVGNLQRASPATISRNGMVWMDPKNLGYKPYYDRWVKEKARRDPEKPREGLEAIEDHLNQLFKNYVKPCIDYILEGKEEKEEVGKPLQLITPQSGLNMVKQLCTIMDVFFPQDASAADSDHLENIFLMALTWSLGACVVDYEAFDRYVRKIAQKSSLPSGSFFDYVYLIQKRRWEPFDVNSEQCVIPDNFENFAKVWVPTPETVRYTFILKTLLGQILPPKRIQGPPVMLIGESGTAKTVIMKHLFTQLMEDKETADKYVILNINFSSRTNSEQVQKTLRESLDPQGKQLGPPGNKQMIVFIDDLNMPKVDFIGTQQPIAFLKFLIERNEWYERTGELELRKIKITYYAGSMTPPGGGNNPVDSRFMSLFNLFHIPPASKESLNRIYTTILISFLKGYDFDQVEKATKITEMSLDLYRNISNRLTRTPLKFHYVFNMRDLSRLYEGICQLTPGEFEDTQHIVRLWRHECLRVFADKLVSEQDKLIVTEELIPNAIKDKFPECFDYAMKMPIVMGNFYNFDPMNPDACERIYKDLVDYEKIRPKLTKIMDDMNTPKVILNLVLFDEAIEHLCRVHRIIRLQRGNALLVGYGGSGRQSIARLAGFTAGYKWFTIQLTKSYGENDFKEDLKSLYKLLLKNEYAFMFTDSHVANESFLELINNILTIGIVPAMFTEEEKEGYLHPIRDEAAKEGAVTKDALWNYFISKCRDHLHLILSMSPAGDTLRVRCRNFPGLLSNTTVDWFFPWPEEALKSVANQYIKDEAFTQDQRDAIIQHMVHVHKSVQGYTQEFEQQYKRSAAVTPKSFLDYISTYRKLLRDLRHSMDRQIQRFDGGLMTLMKANEETKILNTELEKQNKIVTAEKEKCNAILQEINEKTKIVDQQNKDAIEKEKRLSVERKEIAEKKQEADKLLEEAMPALNEAVKQLDDIQASDIALIKGMQVPKPEISETCYFCHLILEPSAGPSWAETKSRMLTNANLLRDLKSLKGERKEQLTESQMRKIKSEINSYVKEHNFPDFKAYRERVYVVYPTAGTLLDYVSKVINYYDTAKKVKPLQNEVKEKTAKLQMLETDLVETKANIEKLSKMLEDLNVNRVEREKELALHTEKANQMKRRLDGANRLITGLSSTQQRWKKESQDLKVTINKLVGDCLLCASFLIYTGPFNYEYRMRMIYKDWYKDISDNAINCTENLTVQLRLTDELEKSVWTAEGLPSDELSVQNGILTTKAVRFPLCIDPQMQAVRWIKNREGSNGLDVLSFKRSDFMRKLSGAIQYGRPVLFEAVDEQLDPLIDPVLEKNYTIEAGQKLFRMGDAKIEWVDSFKLYMTTIIGNPKFTPETMNRTIVINFNVTMQGLKEQLLNEVVAYEKPELEQERKKLISQTSDNKKKLKLQEDTLLKGLSNTTGPLVDNIQLIETLETARSMAASIERDLEEAKRNEESINESRNQYMPVATTGATLFFAMFGLSAISEMYEYSLGSYTEVFCKAISEAKKDSIPQNRILNMKKEVQRAVYNYITTGIFESHKLMFSFHMTTALLAQDGELNRAEFDFFLKGNTSIEENIPKKPTALGWISDNGWKDMQSLISLEPLWEKLVDDLVNDNDKWKEWYDDEKPEVKPFPGEYQNKLDSFQRLLMIRVLRPDRVVHAIKEFIIDKHGHVDPPVLRLSNILQQSSEKNPILFILSPGADPSGELLKFANAKGFGNKYKALPLGKDMEAQAQSILDGGIVKGHWVMLQNCHLVLSWLKDLEGLIEDKMIKPHPDFRLWLTTLPTTERSFPVGILQRSLKVVVEPPEGLRQNMKTMYEKIDESRLTQCKHPAFKDLIYVVSFFHAILQDRKKFGKIGWNVVYGFNESDFTISLDLLSMYLNKAVINNEETLPWSTLRYLIGEAMYGGRVTDDFDRRVLMTYLNEYMGDFIFDKNQPFFFSTSGFDYIVPVCDNYEAYCKFLEQLPTDSTPEVFGLHTNAQIISNTSKAKDLWVDMLKMQTTSSGAARGVNKDEKVEQVANDILSKLKPLFDLHKVREKLHGATSPTQAVLMQELGRFNILTAHIHLTLTDLIKALKGDIAMSSSLDELSNYLFNGFLPSSWRELSPQTGKSLASWIQHYTMRQEQYATWIDKGEPIVMWLSGLHVPESYLSAHVQIACRAKGWALDKSTKITEITQFVHPSEAKTRPELGCYITGLYMEGAKWHVTEQCLIKQDPKELIFEMPVVRIIPIEANKVKLRNKLVTPVYVTQGRRNPRGEGLVFESQLNTKEHPSHWILQGVCLVLNIDQAQQCYNNQPANVCVNSLLVQLDYLLADNVTESEQNINRSIRCNKNSKYPDNLPNGIDSAQNRR